MSWLLRLAKYYLKKLMSALGFLRNLRSLNLNLIFGSHNTISSSTASDNSPSSSQKMINDDGDISPLPLRAIDPIEIDLFPKHARIELWRCIAEFIYKYKDSTSICCDIILDAFDEYDPVDRPLQFPNDYRIKYIKEKFLSGEMAFAISVVNALLQPERITKWEKEYNQMGLYRKYRLRIQTNDLVDNINRTIKNERLNWQWNGETRTYAMHQHQKSKT